MKWISSRKGLVVLLAAVAVFTIALGTWQAWLAQADPAVRWVNDADGQPVGVADCDTAPYNTIAGALGAAAAGDIIRLCEGTYAGATVGLGVVLEGRAEATRDKVVVQGASDGLTITADDVTIRHLKLDGPAGADNGILVNTGRDDTTISDVEATDWNDGIHVTNSTDTVIEKSSLHNNASDGVELVDGGGEGVGNTVRDNEIKDNGDDGVDVDDEDEALVEGNTLSSNSDTQIQVIDKTHVRIHRNQIDSPAASTSDGIWIGGVPAEAFVQIGGSAANANTFTGTFGGSDYYVELSCSAENTVDARYNWWGSAVRADIAARINNDEDTIAECAAPDDVKGAVVFHPWATGPAPTVTPSPTATATATATATPVPGTRDFSLDPAGWHNFVWTGASGTTAAEAFSCIADKFGVAYRYTYVGAMPQWQLYAPGRADITNLLTVNQYDSMLVLITAAGVTCHMPVATP